MFVYVQEILQLSIPEEHLNKVGGEETVLYSFDAVLRDDATQEVERGVQWGSRRVLLEFLFYGGETSGAPWHQ